MTETFSCPMKPSGVPWLGDIPAEWNIERVKSLASIVSTRSTSNDNYIGLENVESGTGRFLPASEEAFPAESSTIAIQKGDVLFGKLRPYLAKCLLSEWDGCCSSEFLVLRTAKTNPRFLKYALLSPTFVDYVNMSTYGTKMPRANWEIVGGAVSAIPPLPEQRAIADFLDERCAAIDAIVEEAKAGIEEYAKWKQSVVFEAVTKGLSPHAKMKDSGVEWIGEVPAEWQVSRVKNEFDCLDYLREPISAENRENKLGLYDYYGASGVIDKIDHYNVDDRVLLIGEDGANLRLRNLPLVYRASGKFWVNNHAHILKEKDGNDYGYFAYALEAGDYNPVITGSAQPKLSQSNLMAFPIAVPPLLEQRAIAAHLDEKCSSIDALIEEKKNLIEDLGTYKKSLIYETVTGKRLPTTDCPEVGSRKSKVGSRKFPDSKTAQLKGP